MKSNKMNDQCHACRIVMRKHEPPGGTLYDNEHWLVVSRSHPIFVPGNLFIVLKRHSEQLADLTVEEAASLGSTIQLTCSALTKILQPIKIYVASYGEGLQHIHFHVTPRTSSLPAGNGAMFFYQQWKALLYRLGLKRAACNETEIAQILTLVRQQFAER